MSAFDLASARDVKPFYVMKVLERAQQLERAGRDIIHMEVGEPDFPVLESVGRAVVEACQAGQTRYTPAAGLMVLREAVAGHYYRVFGVSVSPARIVVTAGASGALQLLLSALVKPGSEVLLTDPGYPCNAVMLECLGGVSRFLPVSAATHYQPTSEQVEGVWGSQTQGVLLASPSNPTGSVLSESAFRAIDQVVSERGGWLLLDEIYQGFTLDRSPETALAWSDRVLVVNSFSKYFAMSGFRLGWLVAPVPLVPLLERLAQNLVLAPNTLAQHAAIEALKPESQPLLEARREELKVRCEVLVRGLRQLGFKIPQEPSGAFYVYATLPDCGLTGVEFVEALLDRAGVAVTPGVDFGDHESRYRVRFAYAVPEARIREMLDRLADFLRGM